MRFVAFGVDFGNLRRKEAPEPGMNDLCQAWNTGLERDGIRIIHWWHKTGNFALDGGVDVGAITNSLHLASVGRIFAAFLYDEFVSWLSEVRGAVESPPPKEMGRRWTPDVVMDTDPNGYGFVPTVYGCASSRPVR